MEKWKKWTDLDSGVHIVLVWDDIQYHSSERSMRSCRASKHTPVHTYIPRNLYLQWLILGTSHNHEHAATQTHPTAVQNFCLFHFTFPTPNKWINNNINDEHAHFHNVHNVKLICKCLLAASLALMTDRPQVTALTAGQAGQMCHAGWVDGLGNLIPPILISLVRVSM